MSLLREITRQAQELPQLEPVDYSAVAQAPQPLNTVEIGHHHASGGFIATFAGDKATGATRLEALGQLVVNGAFGNLHISDRT